MSDIYKGALNNIIAADDLHWNENEKKYTALSSEELNNILLNCIDQGITEENDMVNIVAWATNARVGTILLKNFIENKVKISVDKDGETYFNKKIIN